MEQLDKYKARVKRHNETVKEKYDRVSATLPKGTIDRIKALKITVNAAINESLLAYLDALESAGTAPEHEEPTNTPADNENVNTAITEDHTEKKPLTDKEVLEIWRQRVAENEARKAAAVDGIPPIPEPVQDEEPEQIGFTAAKILEIIQGGGSPEEDRQKEEARSATINRAERDHS